MSSDLFVYGVLTYAELLSALIGQPVELATANVDGYRRRTVRKSGYPPFPAIAPEAGATVEGALVRSLDDQALTRLDAFEEVAEGLYVRCELQVEAGSDYYPAQAYVAGPVLEGRLGEEWSRSRFARRYLEHYRDRLIPRFLEGLSLPHQLPP